MADLKNIRGNYLAQKLGNFPLDCECLNYAQKRDDISQALGCIGGDRFLLSGFNADGSGLVFVKTNECPWGEVMPVKAGSGSTLHLVSEPVRVDFSTEDVFPEAYFDRYLEYGTVYGAGAENFPVASFWKLRSNKVVYEALQAEMQTREAADSSIRETIDTERAARKTAERELEAQLQREIRTEVDSASSTAARSLLTEVAVLNKRIADLETTLSEQIQHAQYTADTAADGLATTQYVNKQISDITTSTNTSIATLRSYLTETIAMRLPRGVIVAWYGTEASIPSGWALCNGQNGTPDLRGRFVLGGVADKYQFGSDPFRFGAHPGETGGRRYYTHKLSVENLPAHTHNAEATIKATLIKKSGTTTKIYAVDANGDQTFGEEALYGKVSVKVYSTGDGTPVETHSIPPFYALCYIMKL